jgi:hypothetical protein
MLLANCKRRHALLPKQPGKIGNAVSLTSASGFHQSFHPDKSITERRGVFENLLFPHHVGTPQTGEEAPFLDPR